MLVTAAGPWGCGKCLASLVSRFWPDACSSPGLGVGFFTVVSRLACIGKVTDNVRFRTKTLCYLGVTPSQHFQCCAL